jgi:hypothetical protein
MTLHAGCEDSNVSLWRVVSRWCVCVCVAVLHMSTFVFAYCIPFLYNPGLPGLFLGPAAVTFSYHGFLTIALQMEK